MVRVAPLVAQWDDAYAAKLGEPDRLLYRSNLLGADKRITNFGGGNTSLKVAQRDPLTGENAEVLWVKGSGGDLGSMKLDGFATLYMDRLEALKGLYRGMAHEDDMVGLLAHCTFNLNPRPASIDTPLHAYLPYRHVDHTHPDAVIAVAASRRSEAITREIYGDEIGWLPWQRPGFDLGLKLEAFARSHPEAAGVVLGGHGLFTWGDSGRSCYLATLRIIQRAQDWLDANAREPTFGGSAVPALDPPARRARAVELMASLRGRIGPDLAKVGNFDDSDSVLEFVGSQRLEELAALGTSCPDHFLRTKICPIVVAQDADGEELDRRLSQYRSDYANYYERHRKADSPPIRDPNPVVYLVPGVGMITFAGDKATARIAGEYYVNAINVMRGASGVDAYVGLDPAEAFAIEYWLLEEAKLQRMPKRKNLAGRVALVTGGAGGIGSAIARRLAAEGACIVLMDIDADAAANAEREAAAAFGPDVVRGVVADVTNENSVARAFADAVAAFGGIDIVVSNAGIAASASVENTTVELWDRNMAILATGYFLVAREAFRLLKTQGLGGSIVFIGSKNGLAPSAGASAYCAAKASELHLARCLALEGAPVGIRVNVVNPDAVLRGSKIWSGEWRQQRARDYGIAETDLDAFYRNRSLLKRSVYPEDIAEAVYFLASDASSKSTGNIINVDAGNAGSFTR